MTSAHFFEINHNMFYEVHSLIHVIMVVLKMVQDQTNQGRL